MEQTQVRTGWVIPAALSCLSFAVSAVAAAPSSTTASTASEPLAAITVDAGVLDGYVGDYQLAPTALITVTREGNQLLAQLTGQPKAEIFAQSRNEFFYRTVNAQISFESDTQGRTTALVLHQNGKTRNAPRIEPALAQQVKDKIDAKIQNQAPTPGSEAALRRLIEGISTGQPNYAQMSTELANATRQQLPQLQAGMAHLGAVQSIEFRGVGNQGWDMYDVKQEHGSSQWRISLRADGIIAGALVTAGP